ncbi:C4-dicarboxylate ABC transporter permease [Pueribacillus theae]|uniref:C4-dicarboxylate ABC transporter permease n=1 Tax=Pueribacillus theae TaxID=2171751 RepID=A0A2U1JJ02_9BACI|nr:TRAP transporter large permease [Pueribacillus theae]PWA05117.1 C4-dicarboxylate ABC transporter permease [Pueribacillus theae]
MLTIVTFFLLMLIGVPIAFLLGVTTLVFVFSTGNTDVLLSMPSKMFNGLQNFGLVAIPMFILLGEIMNQGGITQRLIKFTKTIFGQLRGGLAYVNVVVNMFLASIVGSSNAQSAIMSKVMVPAMEKEGYKKEFSAALTSASSVMGPLIPPSMPFIIFGVTAGVSIGNLFLAGIIPGILFAIAFGLAIYVYAKRNDFPKEDRPSWPEVLKSTLHVLPALAIPVLILVGISTGAFTATESAAIAVFFSIIIGFFIYKELKLKDLGGILIRTVITASTVTFLLATSNIFGWVLNFQQIPQAIANAFLTIADNQFMFLLLANILLLIVGMFIDGVAALILLIPILLPIAVQFGVDPVHFGVIMVLNLTLGLMTPPVGTVLFIVSSITKVQIHRLVKNLIPFLIISFVILLLITYIPWLSLGIPQMLGFK